MKLNNKQIKVLAEQVLAKISENVPEYTKAQEKAIDIFIKKETELSEKIDKLSDERSELRERIQKFLGCKKKYFYSFDKETLLKNIDKDLPSLEQIQDKIVLEAMFESKEDMKSFIDKLVKEFSK